MSFSFLIPYQLFLYVRLNSENVVLLGIKTLLFRNMIAMKIRCKFAHSATNISTFIFISIFIISQDYYVILSLYKQSI